MPAITVPDNHWASWDGLTKIARSTPQKRGAREGAEEVLAIPHEVEGERVADGDEAIEALAARSEGERVEVAIGQTEMGEGLVRARSGAREIGDAVEARFDKHAEAVVMVTRRGVDGRQCHACVGRCRGDARAGMRRGDGACAAEARDGGGFAGVVGS